MTSNYVNWMEIFLLTPPLIPLPAFWVIFLWQQVVIMIKAMTLTLMMSLYANWMEIALPTLLSTHMMNQAPKLKLLLEIDHL